MRDAHVADHQALFRRVSIDLGPAVEPNLPTDQRVLKYAQKEDPQLAALFFQYGRYLMIASSRPGGQPANLQGLWNDSLNPPWDSKYTVNINTEMNYWLTEPTNLSECGAPLFDALADIGQTGRSVAQKHYNAPGWVLHHNFDLWRGAAPINASNHGIWPTGGAWLCQHLWWHYLYTGDKAFLAERAYPLMKGAAEFFVAYLVEDPRNDKRWLISGPSNSPETGRPGHGPDDGPPDHPRPLRATPPRRPACWASMRNSPAKLDDDAKPHRTQPDRQARPAPGMAGGQGRPRRTSTATSRTCGACSPARKSRRRRRSCSTPPSSRSSSAATAAPAGAGRGRSTSGPACSTATTPT